MTNWPQHMQMLFSDMIFLSWYIHTNHADMQCITDSILLLTKYKHVVNKVLSHITTTKYLIWPDSWFDLVQIPLGLQDGVWKQGNRLKSRWNCYCWVFLFLSFSYLEADWSRLGTVVSMIIDKEIEYDDYTI